MSKMQGFPGMLFPNSTTRLKGHTVVDYGVSDAFDIGVENEMITSNARNSVGKLGTEYTLHRPVGTCLPLMKPNNIENLPVAEELTDFSICQHDYSLHRVGREVKTNSKAQMNKFLHDNEDLLLGTFLDEMSPAHRELLYRNFHPLKYAFDIPFTYGRRKFQPLDHRQHFKDKSHAKRYAMFRFATKRPLESQLFIRKLDQLLETISEIPRSILLDYLDEELVMKYDELTENFHIGNCLAQYKNCLIHPKGPFESVCITPLIVRNDDCKSTVVPDSANAQLIKVNGRIQEINCLDFDDQTSVMGIRSDYCCSFLSNSAQDLTDNGKYFNIIDEMHFKSRILAMSINPYFPNEALILLEDGSLKCWTDGQLSFVEDNQIINYCAANEICWINCIYASNPRSVLFVHSEEASIYDMRAPRRPSQLILQLPSQYMNRMDKLARPVCLHPTNPHSILLTSEQGLIVLDERFVKSPLITINHYMRSSPQFMHTLSGEVDSAELTLTFLGGYRYQDTRCLEFEQRSMKRASIFNQSSGQSSITLPPVCTRMPWKLAAPDSCLRNISNDNRIISPGVAKRLRQPLVGLTIMQREASLSKDLIAVQLTKAGDLFYQLLTTGDNTALQHDSSHGTAAAKDSHSCGDSYRGSNCILNERCQTRDSHNTQYNCSEWVACAYEMYNRSSVVNEKASVCLTEIDTGRGNVTKVFESQIESRDSFNWALDNDAIFNQRNTQLRGATSPRGSYEEKEDSIDLGCQVDISQSREIEASSIVHETEGPRDTPYKQCPESTLKNNVTVCCICKRPMDKDSERCIGCNLSNEVSSNVKLAYEGGCFLSNRILGIDSEKPNLRLIRDPNNSKDPLSTTLLTNWINDDFYTPLDLSQYTERNYHNRSGKNETGISSRISKQGDREAYSQESPGRDEDPDVASDGWYLSASGTIEFCSKDTPKAREIALKPEGPVERPRSRDPSRSKGKRKNETMKRSVNRKKYRRSTLNPEKEENNIGNVEDSSQADINQLKFTPNKELASSLPLTKNLPDSVVQDIFSPNKNTTKSLLNDVANSSEEFLSSSTTVTRHLQLVSLKASSGHDGETRLETEPALSRDQGATLSPNITMQDLSGFDLAPFSTPSKTNSPLKVQRTPKKKKISREMGF